MLPNGTLLYSVTCFISIEEKQFLIVLVYTISELLLGFCILSVIFWVLPSV